MHNHFFLALSVFFYVLYMFALLVKMFKTRSRAVRSKSIDIKFYKTYSSEYSEPKELAAMSNHIENQFQLPPIFMVTVALVLSFPSVQIYFVLLAWLFVVTRLMHSYVHLGANNLLNRVFTYAMGWICLIVMWLMILVHFWNL